jgi:dTDP-4-amino-4,6-dideoxygalactose transaminase
VKVPFLRPQLPPLTDVAPYFRLSEEARFYSNGGPCERLLRERLSEYVGGATAIPVNNATNGIMVALLGSTHRAGTRDRPLVVTPSYTFAATAGAVDALGHRPVFVDVDPDGWQLDPDALEATLAEHVADVAAVLVTHTFGVPPAAGLQDRWRATCTAHGVPLVVDAAAGFGAVDADGARTGSGSDTHVFSFHATKPFGAGEGGAITTRDAELAAAYDGVRQFGFAQGRVVSLPGINAKLDELHAAVALAVLDGFPSVLKARRDVAEHYRTHLEPSASASRPGRPAAPGRPATSRPPTPPLATPSCSPAGSTASASRRTTSGPLHLHPAFAGALVHGDLPVTERLAAGALALPMANDLTEAEQARVVEVVLGAL